MRQLLFSRIVTHFPTSEEKGDAPKSRKGDYGIDYTGDYCLLSSADPCHKVKSEKTDTAPVECADDSEYQSESVKYHNQYSLSNYWADAR